ncbi:hypothetical protein DPMN_129034 [Dreissena polymorpha]|uniref:Uncharacterized protein n=1 Tax=Dreissena polymorpha TaxID=45954 RepID=A0A9D4JW96_DREPO|nr:hypothetical protein DPMN_129034 [Dreissena polymorpha]
MMPERTVSNVSDNAVSAYVTSTPGDALTIETTEVWRTLMAVYLGAILFLSLTFNGTLCMLFYKKTHLLSVSNCFVLNLIVCQLCKYYVNCVCSRLTMLVL